jgi:hypothetical protein
MLPALPCSTRFKRCSCSNAEGHKAQHAPPTLKPCAHTWRARPLHCDKVVCNAQAALHMPYSATCWRSVNFLGCKLHGQKPHCHPECIRLALHCTLTMRLAQELVPLAGVVNPDATHPAIADLHRNAGSVQITCSQPRLHTPSCSVRYGLPGSNDQQTTHCVSCVKPGASCVDSKQATAKLKTAFQPLPSSVLCPTICQQPPHLH